MMGNGIAIQTWLTISEFKKVLVDDNLYLPHKEVFPSQRNIFRTTFKLTVMLQKLKFYTRDKEIPLVRQVRDLKRAADMETKWDHMLRIQVKLVAVLTRKVI